MPLRISRLGNGLVIAGGSVGIATVAAMATGIEIHLTPAMVQLVTYKLLGAAAVGLIIVGSWLGRRGREREQAGMRTDARKGDLASGMPPFQYSSRTSAGDSQNEKVRDAHTH